MRQTRMSHQMKSTPYTADNKYRISGGSGREVATSAEIERSEVAWRAFVVMVWRM